MRYNVDGSLDSSFGNGGIVTEDIGGIDQQQFSCVAVLSGGQILIGGETKTASNAWFEFSLARFNSDGGIDLSFGTSGSALWDYAYAGAFGGEYANLMVVQPDGRILLGGQLGADSSAAAIVVRFNADGSWDQAFGHDWFADDFRLVPENGVLTLSEFAAEALVIQPDGKLDLACTNEGEGYLSWLVERLDADGTTVDDSFGDGGEAGISLGSADVRGEVLEPDGSILLAGSYGQVGSGIAIARLTSAGALDTSFNGTGVKLYSFGGVNDGVADAVLQTDGKLLVVGHKGLPDSTSQFAMARFLDDGTPDPTEQMFDLNGPSHAGLGYTTSWSNTGPVHVTDPTATVSDSTLPNLTSLTVALARPQSGDTLVADNSAHPAIAVSFAAGTLSLSGSAPQADYADVLRTITYENSSPPLGVGTVTLNISASDGTLTSTTETTTLLVGTLVLDLNGAAAGTDFSSSWSGFAALPVAITDPANAAVSDPEIANLTQLTAAITSPHTGDSLSANNSAAPGIAVSFLRRHADPQRQRLAGQLPGGIADHQVHQHRRRAAGRQPDDRLASFSTARCSATRPPPRSRFPPILDLNGGLTGTGNTTNWFNSGAMPLDDVAVPRPWPLRASPTSRHDRRALVVPHGRRAGHAGDRRDSRPVDQLRDRHAVDHRQPDGGQLPERAAAAELQQHRGRSGRQLADGHGHGHRRHADQRSGAAHDQRLRCPAGQVLGNRLFYNNSKYDGNNAAINSASDAAAIAPDKVGYVAAARRPRLPTCRVHQGHHRRDGRPRKRHRLARAASRRPTSRSSRRRPSRPSYNNVGSWNDGTDAAAFSVILGAGTGGSDRLEITWNTNAIKNEWLEVNVAADAHTGLSSPDIFFFGNAEGDSGEGDSATQITVNSTDLTVQRNNIAANTVIYNAADYNRDGLVNASDGTVATGNAGFILHFIKNPTGPFAPSGEGTSGDAGISSGLTAMSSAANASTMPAVSNTLLAGSLAATGGLQRDDVARYFQALAVAEASATKRLLVAADEVAETALDDELVDALLADLGLV